MDLINSLKIEGEKVHLGFRELNALVVQRGLCTACGTCAGVCPNQALKMTLEDNEPIPRQGGECNPCGVCSTICPGMDIPLPELERLTFGTTRPCSQVDLGVFRFLTRAHALNLDTRLKGASGGVATALLVYALNTGMIDCALVAGFANAEPWRTEAKLATTAEEIRACAQSKYAAVPINAMLGEAVRQGYQKIGVIALPCQIHAIRKIQLRRVPSPLAQKISLVLGLFCGSQFYFEGTRHLLVEWCKVEDMRDIVSLSYREGEWPGHFVVKRRNGDTISIDRHSYVYHHLIANYKRDRCEMCIDWSAELSDLSLGDFWDPGMKPGIELGTSTCIVRSQRGEDLLRAAVAAGSIDTEDIDPLTVAASIGFELKKHAAVFRLSQRQRFGWPVPNYHIRLDGEPFAKEHHMAPERNS